MTWVIEDLNGTKNGSNSNFTISHVPNADSMFVVLNGVRFVRVAATPTSGEAQYSSSSNNVILGTPPASGDDAWCRYWWE